MNPVLLGILFYVVLQLVFGFLVSRRIRTEDDYLLAGRKLGYGIATFSIFATWFGAESCVGTAGAAYERGIAGVTADPFGYAICLLLMGLVFAVPLWKRKLTTIVDVVRLRYSISAERLTALMMVPGSVLWAAAQVRAFGLVLSASSELTVTIAITIAAAVVIAYTVLGGLLADAMTDLIQGGVLVIGLIVLVPAIVGANGGLSTAFGGISPDKLSFLPTKSELGSLSFLRIAEAWSIPIFGSVLAQELVSRVIATRSPVVARRSSLLAGSMYLFIGLIPVFIGLVGFNMIPGLDHPEQILPLLAQQHLSTFLYILFAGALVSAMLSTVDSALLAASSMLSHNLIVSVRPDMDEKKKIFIGRTGVVAMGIIAYVLALHAEGVYNLVKDASAFGSAGIVVVLIFGLFTKFGGPKSALITLIVGVLVWVTSHYVIEFELSYILALVSSVVTYVVVELVERRISGADDSVAQGTPAE